MNPKALSLLITLALLPVAVQAQVAIPHNASDDVNHVMSDVYWSLWNDSVQAKMDADIERYRKADATLMLPGVKKGTAVKVQQISSDFFFGAHTFNFDQLGNKESNDKYKELFGTLFNSATVPFYWRDFEPVKGQPRFAEAENDTEAYWESVEDPASQPNWRRPCTDKIVEWCKTRGVRVHGHPLMWPCGIGIPKWLFNDIVPTEERADFDRIRKQYKSTPIDTIEALLPITARNFEAAMEKRIHEICRRYYGMIDSWDIVNESVSDFDNGELIPGSTLCKSTRYGFLMPGDYVYKTFQLAEESLPEKTWFNLNDNAETCINYRGGIMAYVHQATDMLSRGCKVDVIGVQMHIFDPKRATAMADGETTIHSPEYIHQWYDALALLDLPMHLSEITIPSVDSSERGLMIQAILARNLYRMWFSLEQMSGITWWNTVDGCGLKGEPAISGIFNRDMTPKPSYYALEELIMHEWRTNETVKVDRNGAIAFRGFKGDYLLTWTDKEGEHQMEYHLQ